ncbi:MAG: autotransporter outer membrane beta-barrel domain-containing protein [Hyphomicrobiales bacterium]|nr:autotransporter outer membrane beta-barrel domain-containing protein [Hyphomicrobiales bacterium]
MCHIAPPPPPELIRGGRLRKTSKGLISFAPFLAGASVLALGALLATTPPVEAGTCPQMGQVRECSGGPANDGDSAIVLTVGAGESLTLTDTADFGINTGTSNAGVSIATDATSTFVTVDWTLSAGVISGNKAFYLNQQGTGDVSINVGGSVSSVFQQGIHVNTAARSGSVEIVAGDLTTGDDAIEVDHQGTGDVSVTVTGNINSRTTAQGIDISTTASSTGVSVAAMGRIQTDNHSIYIDHQGSGMASVTTGADSTLLSSTDDGIILKTSGNVEDVTAMLNGRIGTSTTRVKKSGARIYNNGTGALDIDITGDIYAESTGIYAHADGSVLDIYVNSRVDGNNRGIAIANETTNGAATDSVIIRLGDDAVVSGFLGIRLLNSKLSSESVVYLGGSIISTDTQGSSPNAIQFSGVGDVPRRVVIEAGRKPTITGNINTNPASVNTVSTIEFTGSGEDTFNIGTELEQFIGFNRLRKTGGGTWTFTGTHAAVKAFNRVDINEGRFVWSSENPLRGTSVTVAEDALLEVVRPTSWSSNLTLSGKLAITGAGSGLELDTLTGSGGQIDIDVDFSGGDANLASPKLLLESVDGNPIAVNIRAMGEFPEIPEDDEDESITLGNLIQVTGNADAGAFIVGGALSGGFSFQLVHDDSSGTNRWAVVAAESGGGIEEALYESLPAALTQLAGLESRQQRLRGRQHAVHTAMWGRAAGASGEFEPISTTLATYETENAVAEFGIEAPIRTGNSSLTLGASIAFGDGATNVSALGGVGEIASESIAGTVNAGWERKGIYVDGQLRYTSFDNSIETDAKIADVDVKAYAAGVEVGYAMELDKLTGISLRPDAILVPSTQVSWTSVDFDDFTDTGGTDIALGDGDVLLARAGVAFEDSWRAVAFRGHADVLVPLDGEVVTKLDGTETISEREDPAFDVGVGATYSWGGAYALSADISTQQGGNVAGYAASLGFVYSFF